MTESHTRRFLWCQLLQISWWLKHSCVCVVDLHDDSDMSPSVPQCLDSKERLLTCPPRVIAVLRQVSLSAGWSPLVRSSPSQLEFWGLMSHHHMLLLSARFGLIRGWLVVMVVLSSPPQFSRTPTATNIFGRGGRVGVGAGQASWVHVNILTPSQSVEWALPAQSVQQSWHKSKVATFSMSSRRRWGRPRRRWRSIRRSLRTWLGNSKLRSVVVKK